MPERLEDCIVFDLTVSGAGEELGKYAFLVDLVEDRLSLSSSGEELRMCAFFNDLVACLLVSGSSEELPWFVLNLILFGTGEDVQVRPTVTNAFLVRSSSFGCGFALAVHLVLSTAGSLFIEISSSTSTCFAC